MKKLVKILALALCVVMALSIFAACGEKKAEETKTPEAKEKLVVGITDYEPMNYLDENGKWTGFDTEFAEAFGKIIDREVEFVEIEWDNKWFELESGNIDCVWNGMTITDEAKLNADVSDPYVSNKQVLIVKADAAADIAAVEDFKGTVAAEAGSAGEGAASDAGYTVDEYPLQTDALLAVKSGKADGCVIDGTMADAMIGEGTDYADLAVAVSLTDEEYGVAFKKGSDLLAKFNDALKTLTDDGTLPALAEKYNLTLAN